MTDPWLREACAVVAEKDSQPLRRALFERLAGRSGAVRAALAAWARVGTGRRAAALLAPLATARFLEVRFPDRAGDLLAVWRYANERRQIDALAALDPSLSIACVTLRPAPPPLPPPAGLAEAWDVILTHARRGDFLAAARVAETVGYYLRMLPALARRPERAVLVSSDANPYAMALVAAARRLSKKTCFVTHGHVAEGPPPLRFDLSLLDGPAVREVYARAGPIEGAVVFKGSEGVVRPMDTARLRGGVRALGVVLSILVDWPAVGARLDALRRRLAPARIVLRLHPNRQMRERRWADHVRLDGVDVSDGTRPLTEDAARCDLVVAGNTSAHLTVLKLGVPTVYAPGLDAIGDDYYGFVREGIVPTESDDGSIDRAAIARFYEDRRWAGRFARFDAGYPDLQAERDHAVVAALRGLVAAPPEPPRTGGRRPERPS